MASKGKHTFVVADVPRLNADDLAVLLTECDLLAESTIAILGHHKVTGEELLAMDLETIMSKKKKSLIIPQDDAQAILSLTEGFRSTTSHNGIIYAD